MSAKTSAKCQVAARMRPSTLPMSEQTVCVESARTLSLRCPKSGQPTSFDFDFCYGPHATQQQIFEDLGTQVLDSALEGFNATIFAYGQTGSGKTHAIMGSNAELGIIPRLGVELFARIGAAPPDTSVVVTATYLELYNEVICDLLAPGNQGLRIRQHIKNGIYVEDLTEVQVSSHAEIERLIHAGNKSRQVAATRMNERSSRSHALFTVNVRQTSADAEGNSRVLSSKLTLVDLAGSERADMAADSARLAEGAAINKSLSQARAAWHIAASLGASLGAPGRARGWVHLAQDHPAMTCDAVRCDAMLCYASSASSSMRSPIPLRRAARATSRTRHDRTSAALCRIAASCGHVVTGTARRS